MYTTQYGVDAVVQYHDWALVVTWNHDPTNWAVFASELNAKETADGFLVLEPVDPGWKLGLGDGPDAQLGGTGYGGGATYSFFGPRLYPNGCPTASETTAHTPQGWGVFVGTDPSQSQAPSGATPTRVCASWWATHSSGTRPSTACVCVHRRGTCRREDHDARRLDIRDHCAVVGTQPAHRPKGGLRRRARHTEPAQRDAEPAPGQC